MWKRITGFALLGGFLVIAPCNDALALPYIIEHEFTDLGLIEQISRFRSGAGHDYSYPDDTDPTETGRSMKHYFQPYAHYSGTDDTVPVYAPFPGTITLVMNEGLPNDDYRGKQVWLTPDGYGHGDNDTYEVRLFHVNLDERFPQFLNSPAPGEVDDPVFLTTDVAAGDLLGYAYLSPDRVNFDIAVSHILSLNEQHLISYFDVMPDSLFTAYQARGPSVREDFIITKAYRDANPVDWLGDYNPEDWVVLGEAPSAIPEPYSLLLMAAGLLALGVVLKIRRERLSG